MLLLLLLTISSAWINLCNGELKTVAAWKEMEFSFPSRSAREIAIQSGDYVPGNSVPIDVAVHYKGQSEYGKSRVFVTIPRFVDGIPQTLGVVSSEYGTNGPKLMGYPNYEWQSSRKGANCDGFTSVFRVAIDPCQRMWVLDTGRIGNTQYCPPQLVVFNLLTDTLVMRYKLPESVAPPGSLFITPILDVADPPPIGQCNRVKVLMADCLKFGVVVFDSYTHRSWRIESKFMYPHIDYGTHTISGDSFELMDGVFGLAIAKMNKNRNTRYFGNTFQGNFIGNGNSLSRPPSSVSDDDRCLYFHAFASINEYCIPLNLAYNESIWEHDPAAMPRAFYEVGSRGIESGPSATDAAGNVFFNLVDPSAIACWNPKDEYSSNNIHIIARNETTLQFVSGLKVILNGKGEQELWSFSNRFNKIAAGTLDPNDFNFRIQASPLKDLMEDIICGKKRGGGYRPGGYSRFV